MSGAMATAYVDETLRLRRDAGLDDAMIARATGAARSTVRDWFARRSAPTGARAERLGELSAIVDRLPRVMRVDYIPVWLAQARRGARRRQAGGPDRAR